jgi:hypothetical protein
MTQAAEPRRACDRTFLRDHHGALLARTISGITEQSITRSRLIQFSNLFSTLHT